MSDFLTTNVFNADILTTLFQVILIDLVLAGDNAIVIGLAAAGLPKEQRGKAILIGIGAATLLRIVFAGLTTHLLQIVGLLLAGGILLLWVCWKMWRELRSLARACAQGLTTATSRRRRHAAQDLAQATWQIVVADVSMSLDNVLAVAGAAREHPVVLIFGLALSIAMMGVAAILHCAAAAKSSLDRVCRPCGHSLCRRRHDLSRHAGSRSGSTIGHHGQRDRCDLVSGHG